MGQPSRLLFLTIHGICTHRLWFRRKKKSKAFKSNRTEDLLRVYARLREWALEMLDKLWETKKL